MELTNSSRFIIEKNAIDFLKASPIYSKNLLHQKIAKKENFSFHYQWDTDFKKFFRLDKEKITHIANTYNDLDLLLKNIYFEKIFANILPIARQILETLASNTESKLSIINIAPLEWAILWRILQDFWLKNIVYNFNRSLSLNSPSKTLEWVLYLFSYENSDYFKEKTKETLLKLQEENYNISNEKHYIIIDENNNKDSYEHLQIDNYLKTQIGIKEQKNIYRLDTYPDENFLLNKDIKNIYVFDNDDIPGKMIDFYTENIKTIPIKKYKYFLVQEKKIGYYEDYLISKNKEYLVYKKNIEIKALNNYRVYNNTSKKSNYSPEDYVKTNYNKFNEKKSEENNYHYVPYVILFPILLVSFLANDLSKLPNFESGSSWGSTYIWWNYGWSIWWGGSSTISSPKSEGTSIIKSFWWWGFSKWWW